MKLSSMQMLNGHEVLLVSLTGNIDATKFHDTRLRVICRNNETVVSFLFSCRKLLIDFRPDIVQSWMYHADLFTSILRLISGRGAHRCKYYWSIRNSNFSLRYTKIGTFIVRQLLAIISYFHPSAIISCSYRATSVHRIVGYRGKSIVYIPNAVYMLDSRFRPRSHSDVLVGAPRFAMFCRSSPQKGLDHLLDALVILVSRGQSIGIDLYGSGHAEYIKRVAARIGFSPVKDCGHTRKPILKMVEYDVILSTSLYGEAFPNVVAEAVAAGCFVIGSDVGDTARLIGGAGYVYKPGDSVALVRLIERCIAERPYKDIRRQANIFNRIKRRYDPVTVYSQWMSVYETENRRRK